MRNITTIGIDIAKNIFQIHALDANGKPMLTKRVKRSNLLSTLAQFPISTVGMEACGSAHHWAREITREYRHKILHHKAKHRTCTAAKKESERLA